MAVLRPRPVTACVVVALLTACTSTQQSPDDAAEADSAAVGPQVPEAEDIGADNQPALSEDELAAFLLTTGDVPSAFTAREDPGGESAEPELEVVSGDEECAGITDPGGSIRERAAAEARVQFTGGDAGPVLQHHVWASSPDADVDALLDQVEGLRDACRGDDLVLAGAEGSYALTVSDADASFTDRGDRTVTIVYEMSHDDVDLVTRSAYVLVGLGSTVSQISSFGNAETPFGDEDLDDLAGIAVERLEAAL